MSLSVAGNTALCFGSLQKTTRKQLSRRNNLAVQSSLSFFRSHSKLTFASRQNVVGATNHSWVGNNQKVRLASYAKATRKGIKTSAGAVNFYVGCGLDASSITSTLQAALLVIGSCFTSAVGSFFTMSQQFQTGITIPWRPEQVWIPVVFFIIYRPMLWTCYRITQTLRGLQDRISMENFTESFWGFLAAPMKMLGAAVSVNWLADTLVLLLESTGNTVSPAINVLGCCDAASYIIVAGFFMYKLQDYYLDEFFDLFWGKNKVEAGVQDLIHRLLEVAILLGTVLSACQTLGASASLITGLYSLLGVGFGFASQQVLQNFFGGLMLVFMRPFEIGDEIEMTNPERQGGTVEGQVFMIGYYNTIILDQNGNVIYVPNQWFVSVELKNKTRIEGFQKLRSYQKEAIQKTSS